MIDVDKVRKWFVRIESAAVMNTLPLPSLIVGEEEDGSYRQPSCSPCYIPPHLGGQITLTVSGKGILRTGSKSFECLPGTAFCYRFCDPSVSYFTAPGKKWAFVWISLRGPASERLIAEVNARYGHFFTLGADSRLEKALLAYRRYANSVLHISPFEGARISLSMLEMLCSPATPVPSAGQQLVNGVNEYIENSLNEPFSAKSLARKVNVSREHLSRVFRKETGTTLHDYCAEHQLQEALSLLLKSNLNCKEIAMLCNYGSYSAFFRSFRKKYGVSPRKFRRDSEA